MTLFHIDPVVLEGRFVRLEPLRPDHAEALFEAAESLETFRYFTHSFSEWSVEAMRQFIADRTADGSVGYAVWSHAERRIVGSSTYFDIDPFHRLVEIGYTFYSPSARRTPVNPEAKLLLIGHAIESCGANRVQLKTDARNLASQGAMEKLGLVREGTFRRHRVMPDGFVRDTVFYSVIPEEWPAMKAQLLERIGR